MVRARPNVSPRLEERYRRQVRALRAVLLRLDLAADIPVGLKAWLASRPGDESPLTTRAAAEAFFEPLITAANRLDVHDREGQRSPVARPSTRVHESTGADGVLLRRPDGATSRLSDNDTSERRIPRSKRSRLVRA